MPDTQLLVEIDGTAVEADAITQLVEVIAEEAVDAADAVSVVAAVDAGADGQWTSLLDPLTAPRTPLVVGITRGDVAYRFDGSSTEADWQLDAAGASQLTIKAIDKTLDMDAEEKIAAWPGNSDSTIAEAIFGTYGLSPQVDSTPDGPDPDVHVVLQRATDWGFLRALAAKWGYNTFVEADGETLIGHFRAIDPLADPQGTLSLGFGGGATKVSVTSRLTSGHHVTGSRVKALADSTDSGDGPGDDQSQGQTALGGQTTVLLSPTDVFGEIDATATATGLARQSAFVVSMAVDIDVNVVGLMLRARRTVLVKGLGDSLSGRYLVQKVRNKVTPSGHTQSATLVRNALGLSGDEPWDAGGGLLGGLL
jgi:hypothetical protein